MTPQTSKKPQQRRKVHVPWGDHVLKGQKRRTVARPMKKSEKAHVRKG